MSIRPTKSWSSTLRLPKSSFPTSPRPLPAQQPKYLQKCSDDLYRWQAQERSSQKPFILHDGPPYANGSLHIGHALNKILKDIICRIKLQQGHRVVYVPGWDCHGLPIEIKALEKHRENAGKHEVLDAIAIRRAARNLATKTVKEQMKGFREWGIMADWDKAWRTMDKSFEMKQLGVFQEMVRKGLIFRRYKPSRLPMVLESCFKDKTVDILVPSIPGSDLQGLMYTNQLRGQTSDSQPLIHADFVSADSGTGLVHCAPGHGMDDYEVCTRLGIEAMAPVDNLGCFTDAAFPDDPSALSGKSVLSDGISQVLSLLGDQILFTSNYKHKYPYDWRTKLPVIVRATEQWFADVGDVKSVAMSRLNEVAFIPQTGKHRLESFVKSRSEWCISRQRAWGVPIPALYDEDGVAVLTDTSVAHIVSAIDARGIDAWWSDPEDDPAWIPEGADALRLWVASSDYTKDVVIGQPVLASINSALLKYRITFKMLLGSMHASARNAPLTKLDIIALAQLNAVMKEVKSAYEAFEFYKAINAINRWIHTDVSAFYLEASKDRLYCGDGGGVLEHIFHGLLRMLAPITPSLVEEAWSHLPAWMQAEDQVHPLQRSLNHEIIPTSLSPAIAAIEKDIPWLMNAMAAIKVAQEEARAQKIIGSSLESSVVLILPEQARTLFEGYAAELESIFVVSSVSLGGQCEGAWRFSAEFDAPGGKGVVWVLPPSHAKCSRCWRYVAPAQDEVCKRCEEFTTTMI
ncbi:hypothetical protein CJF30_00000003 [Rutstroemia sp. NJR-2017a BBW]|nr:hypothetical protein CJF30_00000003 [Rutstroemia sp. NJR-2017a BBW]